MSETAVGYSLECAGGSLPDGTPTKGEYRILVGVNAPDVLGGQAKLQGDKVLEGSHRSRDRPPDPADQCRGFAKREFQRVGESADGLDGPSDGLQPGLVQLFRQGLHRQGVRSLSRRCREPVAGV